MPSPIHEFDKRLRQSRGSRPEVRRPSPSWAAQTYQFSDPNDLQASPKLDRQSSILENPANVAASKMRNFLSGRPPVRRFRASIGGAANSLGVRSPRGPRRRSTEAGEGAAARRWTYGISHTSVSMRTERRGRPAPPSRKIKKSVRWGPGGSTAVRVILGGPP